ncbi:MAG: hypothetical protein CMG05_03095 [Candidatus Marinimicrobia bacterium]|nr:hypothetical protein [Candidatus Neomarinimicrobiota bacterium]|tara:strand:- start:3478 stop:4794 length:1317 start_codon:yes stop_codon:yes gene_type:complete
MKSIYDLLLDWHQIDSNFIFLRENRSYTLNEVVHEVESISKSLSYISSENIAIYLSSKLDFIFVYLACINSNKIPIILKTTWGKGEVDSIIHSNNIKHIICSWDSRHLFNNNINTYYLEELVNSSKGCGIPQHTNNRKKYETVIFTSGSSGEPKGVCLKRSNFKASAQAWDKQINFNANDHYALCLPLHHISGLSILYRSIYYKFSMTLFDSYKQIINRKNSIISLVPTALESLINNEKFHKPLKFFRAIILGGEACKKDLLIKCINLELNIFISYGMTETCSGVSGFWLKHYPEQFNSVGIPFSDVNISIDEDKRITIVSPMNMYNYFVNNHENDNLKTSDFGEIKDDFLYLLGRSDDLIKHKGENINLKYIENILIKHDLIHSVKVFIENSKIQDDLIVAEVVSKDKSLDVENLQKWCKIKIGKYKTPKKITISYM